MWYGLIEWAQDDRTPTITVAETVDAVQTLMVKTISEAEPDANSIVESGSSQDWLEIVAERFGIWTSLIPDFDIVRN